MLEQFLNHLQEKKLCGLPDRVLCAVSGGVDSMVLLHLFVRAGFKVGVAHVNFGLRAEAADEEEHVRGTCISLGLPFYTSRVDTRAYARAHKISTQVAARELRYAYFHKVMQEGGFNHVATGHHASDNLETVLLNLVRGTGIDGLTGIPAKNGNVIRPLLFATRTKILEWARENNIAWREDSSNRADYYSRNLMRNKVVPHLLEINPALEESFARTLERLAGIRHLAGERIRAFREEAVTVSETGIVIDADALNTMEHPAVLLWELLKESGFTFDQCKDIAITRHSGKQFRSPTHQLTVDRNRFLVRQLTEVRFADVAINESDTIVQGPTDTLHLGRRTAEDFSFTNDSDTAQIDLDSLAFPLTWRRWREGDAFIPLGMTHRKKVSDFLIDRKVPLPDKERVTVLESAGSIAWVVGFRIAEPFKITSATRRILIIRKEAGGNDFV